MFFSFWDTIKDDQKSLKITALIKRNKHEDKTLGGFYISRVVGHRQCSGQWYEVAVVNNFRSLIGFETSFSVTWTVFRVWVHLDTHANFNYNSTVIFVDEKMTCEEEQIGIRLLIDLNVRLLHHWWLLVGRVVEDDKFPFKRVFLAVLINVLLILCMYKKSIEIKGSYKD